MRRAGMRCGALLVAVSLGSGCSLAFVNGPTATRAATPGREPSCTTSFAAPVVDTTLIGLLIARDNYLLSLPPADRPKSALWVGDFGEVALLAAGLTTVVSLFFGYQAVHRCRVLEAQANPYAPPGPRPTRQERAADEAAEEAAVQQRLRERAAAEAKAAGEAAAHSTDDKPSLQPAHAPK